MITRGIQIAASGMMSLLDKNDVLAHNLANVNTSGFKKSDLTFKSLFDARIEQRSIGSDIKNAQYRHVGDLSTGSKTNSSVVAFTQGTLSRTENPLDLAIEGDGFFKIRDLEGNISYTRNGQFCINNQNRLVTHDGENVLDVRNRPITIDFKRYQSEIHQLVVNTDGQIVLNNPINPVQLQKIPIYDFSDKTNLQQLGSAKFRPTNPNTNPQLLASKFSVQQGAVELSNTSTINEMINSINVSRTYETLSKLVKEDSTLLDTAINLGRVRQN